MDNAIIITLVIMILIIILCYFGINLLTLTGTFLQQFTDKSAIFSSNEKNNIGKGINYVSNLVADSAKVGIDITNGAVNDVGNLIQNKDTIPVDKKIESFINTSPFIKNEEPQPCPGDFSLQKPMNSMKNSWSLTGNTI
jgi:hypothetical protein